MLKRFYPPKNDHLSLSNSETESDNELDSHIPDRHLNRKSRINNRQKSIKKEYKRSNYKKEITVLNGESSQDKEAFKKEPENEVIKEAKKYQEYMKKFPVPEPISVSVSLEPSSFVTWEKLGESMKQKYEQPLHYLTQILLKQWDESSGNGINNNNIEVMIMKKKPIGNVIDPCTAEETQQQHIHKHFSISILVVMTSSGESSSRRNATMVDAESEQLSPLSKITLQNVKNRPYQKKNRKLPGGSVRYFDNSNPRYSWLLNGWLAEERRVPSGRLYRYFYDPVGRQYRTKTKVLCAWEKMGVIFIHP
ncbi:hypothetical protein ES288_A10G269600v1 [Gossypium darwinii]|uniref:MBD domain-containing protein n=1 Tax=Gossypium darwinii TaxID=34276 RepID=A0A5D2F4D3_GOSDA|nr:hypothetical protein ES288_A10G269600v1 [Gossypium darwinii]